MKHTDITTSHGLLQSPYKGTPILTSNSDNTREF